jgi:hypothetical protein
MAEGVPAITEDGLAEHEICGGFLGRSLMVKLAWQLACPFLPSVMLAPTV